MSARKITAALFALALLAPATSVFAQTVPAEDGWYSAGDTVTRSPKPSCGKMPKDGEYEPLFKMEGGVYTTCRWSYKGPKKKAVYTGWGWFQCSMQHFMSVEDCRAGLMNFVTPTQYFSGGFQPDYSGFRQYGGYQQPYYSGGGYQRPYVCRNQGDPACYQGSRSGGGYYPPPPPTRGPVSGQLYVCRGSGDPGCYQQTPSGGGYTPPPATQNPSSGSVYSCQGTGDPNCYRAPRQ